MAGRLVRNNSAASSIVKNIGRLATLVDPMIHRFSVFSALLASIKNGLQPHRRAPRIPKFSEADCANCLVGITVMEGTHPNYDDGVLLEGASVPAGNQVEIIELILKLHGY